MMLNMPGRRCRWCSNPDKIYIATRANGGEILGIFRFFPHFFLAGQDMVPNSVRLKDEKPLLDMHIFGSAKPVRKVEVMQGSKLLPKSARGHGEYK